MSDPFELVSQQKRGSYRIVTEVHAAELDGSNIEIRKEKNEVILPNGNLIILAHKYADETRFTLHDTNHNIFRLDKDGNVIWQVQREEQGKIRWDLIMAEVAEKGEDAASFSRIPFSQLWLENTEGKRFQSDVYIHGCKLIALASGGRNYEVDIETGVAINIDEPGKRLW